MNRGIRIPVIVALMFLCVPFSPAGLCFAQDNPEAFYNSQIAHFFEGLDDPQAANARVRGIWMELVLYSHHEFAVVPAQNFTAGQALPSGVILLDLSIAADPSVEVTRFFLAHEWGHEMHGDPLRALTPVGQYLMATGGTQIEDNADVYAATFMSHQGHDIQPVIDFFCALPDAGPSDTHSAGPIRAGKIAKIYGMGEDNPCMDPNPDVHEIAPSPTLDEGIRHMALSARNGFSGTGSNSTVKLQLPASAKISDCTVENGECKYILNISTSESGSEAAFQEAVGHVRLALGSWSPVEYHCLDSEVIKYIEWPPSEQRNGSSVIVELTSPSTVIGKYFVQLGFESSDSDVAGMRDYRFCDPVIKPRTADLVVHGLNEYIKRAADDASNLFHSLEGQKLPDDDYASKVLLSYNSEIASGRIFIHGDQSFLSTILARELTADSLQSKYEAAAADVGSAISGWKAPTSVPSGYVMPQLYFCKTDDGPCVVLWITSDTRSTSSHKASVLELRVMTKPLGF